MLRRCTWALHTSTTHYFHLSGLVATVHDMNTTIYMILQLRRFDIAITAYGAQSPIEEDVIQRRYTPGSSCEIEDRTWEMDLEVNEPVMYGRPEVLDPLTKDS